MTSNATYICKGCNTRLKGPGDHAGGDGHTVTRMDMQYNSEGNPQPGDPYPEACGPVKVVMSASELARLEQALSAAEERTRELQELLDGALSACEAAEDRARRARVEGMREALAAVERAFTYSDGMLVERHSLAVEPVKSLIAASERELEQEDEG